MATTQNISAGIPAAAASWLPARPVSNSGNGAKKKKDPLRLLKQGIWAYYFLLIFEGALRKWFLPGLSAPLLIIRDPIGITLLFMAISKGVFQWNRYVISMIAVTLVAMTTTMLMAHGNAMVTLFGARLFIIHFPLLFVIGKVFERDDVVKMGKITLLICIPMTVLVGMQFYSPQSAWVNRGVGGDEEGAGFTGALDYMRPPGTFSFTNGNTLFYGFTAAYVVYFWISTQKINRYLLLAATGAVLLTIPLSISRSLLAEVLICIAFAFAVVARKPKYAGRIIGASIIMVLVLVVLSQVSIFQTASEALLTRFSDAESSEGTSPLEAFIDRFTAGISYAYRNSASIPFFGKGLGMGTNVGALILSGTITFMISEGEWGRIIGETGFFIGLTIILIRVAFVIEIGVRGYKTIGAGNIMPWMLLSFGALSIMNGQWGQPTSLGFSTLIGGLILASFKQPKTDKKEPVAAPKPIANKIPNIM